MKEIIAKNANDLFIKCSNELLQYGVKNSPRGQETIELNDVWIQLNDPLDSVVSLKSRNINYDYLNAEMDWYLNGTYNIDKISKHSNFWLKLQDENGNVNSNYGMIVFNELNDGVSQYDWVINSLNEDLNTRQALINYNQPKHKIKGTKDFVCTLNQLFRVHENKLDSTVFMRSNDLIYGLTYDLPWFTYIQRKVAHDIGVKIGKYNHFAASLHVYKKHYSMLENIASENIEVYT